MKKAGDILGNQKTPPVPYGPTTALRSLPSVALSSVVVKPVYLLTAGGRKALNPKPLEANTIGSHQLFGRRASFDKAIDRVVCYRCTKRADGGGESD